MTSGEAKTVSGEIIGALRTLNAALMLRGEEGGGFTTIDLLALQRPTGAGTNAGARKSNDARLTAQPPAPRA